MNKDKDYYKILGLSEKADKKEIRSAYRSLARKFHPDVNPGNRLYEEKFKELGEAYSVLIDDQKRYQYDILRGLHTPSGVDNKEQAKKQARDAYNANKQEEKSKEKKAPKAQKPKKSFTDVFSDVVCRIFEPQPEPEKKQKSPPKEEKKLNPVKGENITADISITITEAHNGTVRKVNILRTEICSKCKGKKLINNNKCSSCECKGEVSNHKKLNVKIPAGVKEGSKIRITGEGNRGQNGGENGDLFLQVHILKNSIFNFEGNNVLVEIPITPTEAALGAEITVPTIDGDISMKIPPESQSGQKFRLSGQGIPDARTSRRGDQIVTVKIEIPPNLSTKEKELYVQLSKVRRFNPREHLNTKK